MKEKFVHVQGVPAMPVNVGQKAVIFHSEGYLRTDTVLSVYHSPMGPYLLATETAAYWITPGVPDPMLSAANALCA